jgi:hypothetical protein
LPGTPKPAPIRSFLKKISRKPPGGNAPMIVRIEASACLDALLSLLRTNQAESEKARISALFRSAPSDR